MTHPILSRIPLVGRFVDERFLDHRRRSTSIAGMVGALTVGVFFEYRLIVQHVISWDLFTVLCAMAVTKIACMFWQHLYD